MNKLYKTSAAVLSAALMTGSLAACSTKPADNWAYQYEAPTAESLLNTSETQNRYLSLPESRVVLNPFNFESQSIDTTQSQYSNSVTMPLNFGFCDPFMGEGRGVEVANAMLMAAGEGTQQAGGVETLWQANLDSSAGWSASSSDPAECAVEIGGGSVSVTVGKNAQTAWQHVETPVTVDVDNAYLMVTVDSISGDSENFSSGNFSIKVNDGSVVDVGLTQTSVPGTYTFNLKDATGWSGTKSFSVKLFSINKGAQVTFSNVKILAGDEVYEDAVEYTTSWRPDRLDFEASYADGTEVKGKDFFYDEKTVVRDMVVTGSHGFLLYGDYNGAASISGNTVLINQGNFQYAVTPSADVQPRFYSSLVEARAGGEGSETPGEAAAGVWAYQISDLPEDGSLRVAFAFDTKEAAAGDVVALSQKPGDDCTDKMAERTRQWDELLTRVPRPGTFELDGIDAKGVTADDVKQSYYEAWVQIIINALPASPEIDYPHRSFATGKASLWGYGSPKCGYSATWESFYGISYYVQIDADAAWDMYRGFMSLVDETGMIAGESLPSNNARVGWKLYTVKPDKEALAEVQPELAKHLEWRFKNPRWIFKDVNTDAFQKDMDFVAAALIDTQYLMRINEELGLESENEKWEKKVDELYSNMQNWFFSKTMEYPCQTFTLKDHSRGAGYPLWTLKALHVPGLRQEETDELLRLFDAKYEPEQPFGGLTGTKYEPYIYTLMGLAEHGRPEEARVMILEGIRDIVRSGIHAEGYVFTSGEPQGEGVRPSMFGVATMIDCVWMVNGLRMDDGMPVFSNYFDTNGGVENIKVDGKTFNLRKEGGTYTYGGGYVGKENKTLEVEADNVGYPFEGTKVHPLHG